MDIEYKQWGLEWKVEFDITVTADAGQRGGKMNVFNMMGMYFPVSTLHNKVKCWENGIKDLFYCTQNVSNSTLYPDVLKTKTTIVVKQKF